MLDVPEVFLEQVPFPISPAPRPVHRLSGRLLVETQWIDVEGQIQLLSELPLNLNNNNNLGQNLNFPTNSSLSTGYNTGQVDNNLNDNNINNNHLQQQQMNFPDFTQSSPLSPSSTDMPLESSTFEFNLPTAHFEAFTLDLHGADYAEWLLCKQDHRPEPGDIGSRVCEVLLCVC